MRLDEEGQLVREAGGRVTREIGIRELKNRASEVIERISGGERAVITRRSELVAVILSIDESVEFVLAHAEDFVHARRRARDEHRAEGVIYEIRFSAAATARYRAAVASRRQIRYGVRMLAARAALRARSLRSRTATGALADSFGLADAVAIRWVRDRESGFFLIRAGRELIACDVLPERRIVLVLTIVGRHELAARLGLPTSASPYSFAHTVFSSR